MSQSSDAGTGSDAVGPAHALRPDRAVRPDVDFMHLADDARLDAFDRAAQAIRRAALVAHLRDDAGFLRQIAQIARLVNRLRQRLLAIDVFAQPHRRARRRWRENDPAWKPSRRQCPCPSRRTSCGNPGKISRCGYFCSCFGAARGVHVAQAPRCFRCCNNPCRSRPCPSRRWRRCSACCSGSGRAASVGTPNATAPAASVAVLRKLRRFQRSARRILDGFMVEFSNRSEFQNKNSFSATSICPMPHHLGLANGG